MEHIIAKGHANIKATHPSTFEVTKENWLTPQGDCIIGISASKSPKQFSKEFKNIAKREDAVILAILLSNGAFDYIIGKGSEKLTFKDNTRMVFRKSSYISNNTVMIKANKAARDISRKLIDKLKKGRILHILLIAISV
ncbi:MAG: hypothetical protein B6U75_02105 [Desulfurococcales archaeon ex4484_217_1]|nr:MAG: hypothetical protein B6U75_02105 [Desulfurococcales archaeon ex4484_217_1]